MMNTLYNTFSRYMLSKQYTTYGLQLDFYELKPMEVHCQPGECKILKKNNRFSLYILYFLFKPRSNLSSAYFNYIFSFTQVLVWNRAQNTQSEWRISGLDDFFYDCAHRGHHFISMGTIRCIFIYIKSAIQIFAIHPLSGLQVFHPLLCLI